MNPCIKGLFYKKELKKNDPILFDLILLSPINNLSVKQACADPGTFVRGGPGQADNLFFFSPQLILQKSNGQFQRNLSFFKVPEGV